MNTRDFRLQREMPGNNTSMGCIGDGREDRRTVRTRLRVAIVIKFGWQECWRSGTTALEQLVKLSGITRCGTVCDLPYKCYSFRIRLAQRFAWYWSK